MSGGGGGGPSGGGEAALGGSASTASASVHRPSTRTGRLPRRLAVLLFRYEWLAWVLLAVALWASVAKGMPALKMRFGFKDALRDGHPVRVAFDQHEKDFELRQQLFVYFEGPGVFEPEFLAEATALAHQLRRRQELRGVVTPVDLPEPVAHRSSVRLLPALRQSVREDPAALAQALRQTPFDGRWVGFLHDEDLEVFVMILQLETSDEDPLATTELRASIDGMLEDFARRTGVKVFQNGLFFINHEMLRVTFENQSTLTGFSMITVAVVMAWMFGSLGMVLATLALLGISTVLAFGAMGALGVPVNGLSGNLPTMIIVIGLADIIHIAGRHCTGRRRYGSRGAAIRAMLHTAVPNLFTTLTTLGCLGVMNWTELEVLASFAQAVCLGISLVYLVTILYGPLLLARLSIQDGQGGISRIQRRIEAALQGRVQEVVLSARTPAFFAGLGAACLALSISQTVDSNWFRRFRPGMPVAESLDFLSRREFPVTTLELRLPSGQDADVLLQDDALMAALGELEQRLGAVPGVMGVFSAAGIRHAVDVGFQRLELPATLAPVWRRARLESLYRQAVGGGSLDQYHSTKTGDLRVILATRVESARQLVELRDAVLAAARAQPVAGLDLSKVEVAGQMLYWGALMDYVGSTFFSSLAGSLGVVFLCFLLLTRRWQWAVLAMIPNLLPALAIFSTARLLGEPLDENFCMLLSLSIGIAVDDTLHLLYHCRQRLEEGAPIGAAASHALVSVGAPVITTSLVLVAGFLVCLLGTLVPTYMTGYYMGISISVALASDLLLLPGLLVRWTPEG